MITLSGAHCIDIYSLIVTYLHLLMFLSKLTKYYQVVRYRSKVVFSFSQWQVKSLKQTRFLGKTDWLTIFEKKELLIVSISQRVFFSLFLARSNKNSWLVRNVRVCVCVCACVCVLQDGLPTSAIFEEWINKHGTLDWFSKTRDQHWYRSLGDQNRSIFSLAHPNKNS